MKKRKKAIRPAKPKGLDHSELELRTAERRAKVAELRMRGVSQRDIAKQLEVHEQTVYEDMKENKRLWRERRIEAMDTIVDELLATLELTTREAFAEWERSKQPAECTVETTKPDGVETRHETRGQCGDPRYLSVIQAAVKSTREMLGVDAPTKSESTIKTDTVHKTREEMTREILDRLAACRAATKGRNKDE